MRRASPFTLLLLPLFFATFLPAADDPTAAKLDKAKETFKQKVERFKADLVKDLDVKENQARAKGDKKLVDQVKAERAAFTEHGQLPHVVSTTTFDTRVKQARSEVEAAYGAAVKDLVKNKKDDQAAAVEKDLQAFLREADGSAGAVDLLAMIDLSQDATKGHWSKAGGGIVNQAESKVRAYLQLPYTPPDEYELEMVVERTTGNNDLMIGTMLAGRRFVIVLDGWASTTTGISFIDGKGASDNETTTHGKLLSNGKPATVVVRVTKGEVTFAVDGKQAIKYVGAAERLSGDETGAVRAGIPYLAVTAGTSYRIDAIRLKPITGTGKPLR
jgi:hypothetical protein